MSAAHSNVVDQGPVTAKPVFRILLIEDDVGRYDTLRQWPASCHPAPAPR